jgi:fluoride exporter
MLGDLSFSRLLGVALGGALGSVARVLVVTGMGPLSVRFPWGTFAVNALGSLAIGFLAARWLALPTLSPWRLFAIAGFLGGFTTFSAFSLENLNLLRQGRFLVAAGYIALSTAVGLLAAALGFWFGKSASH